MSTARLARRYAEALADVATVHDQVEQVDREVLVFGEMMKSNLELHEVVASPVISQIGKRRVLDAIIERVRPGQITVNLLRAMLGHHRLHYLAEVHEQFRRVINQRKGLIIAEVTTAAEFGGEQLDKLASTLHQITGKQVEFKFKTDPSLIGGAVTRIESVVFDGSVRTQLKEIKERLKRGDSAI